MSKEKEVGMFDKVVISFAILGAIVSLFKAGVVAAIIKFIFIIVFFYAARGLWKWVISDRH